MAAVEAASSMELELDKELDDWYTWEDEYRDQLRRKTRCGIWVEKGKLLTHYMKNQSKTELYKMMTCISTIYSSHHIMKKKIWFFTVKIPVIIHWYYAIMDNRPIFVAAKDLDSSLSRSVFGNDIFWWGSPFRTGYEDTIMKMKFLYDKIEKKDLLIEKDERIINGHF